MSLPDIFFILRWFVAFFAIGIAFFPLTFFLFNDFKDKGYIFSKIIGLAFLSYFVFLLGLSKIAKFSTPTVCISLVILFLQKTASFTNY